MSIHGAGPVEGIVIHYEHFCADHLNQLDEYDIPFFNAIQPTLGVILGDDTFYETAYRIKNGYGIPDGVDRGDVPEGERPDNPHINEAIKEFSPVCCYIEENHESETKLPPFLEALAKVKQEELEDA